MVSVKQSRTVAGWFGIAFHLFFLVHYSSASARAAAPGGAGAAAPGGAAAGPGAAAAPGPGAAAEGPGAAAAGGHLGACKPVKLTVTKEMVLMDNGIIKVNLSNPEGSVAGILYQGVDDNLLELSNKIKDRGYWDLDWNTPKEKASTSFKILATDFKVIMEKESQVEVSFKKTYKSGDKTDIPINIDKRFVMLPGSSGFYTYAIYDHPKGGVDVDLDQTRVVFKLSRSLFTHLAVTDEIQGEMPSYKEREEGEVLNYKEAVKLTKTENPKLKGKYALDSQNMSVYGWISPKPHLGFWIITASNEFRLGGPLKQDLTCHCGPFALSMFLSLHYSGDDWGIKLRGGEAWKMVFGPVFIYINSDKGTDHKTLWEGAKKQMLEETKLWPYSFPKSEDYPKAAQRGAVSGRLLIHDPCAGKTDTPAKCAHVGLAKPGEPGSWQNDSMSYQFWTRTDDTGKFEISAVRAGEYSLYAWVPGHLGDFKHKADITIKPGCDIKVGDLVFTPLKNGTTVWEIGIPDRSAAEFFIPEPAPDLKNYLLSDRTEKFRQYGLWDRYSELHKTDLVYTVGKSDPAKDWFFAQVTRKNAKGSYEATIWTVVFPIETVAKGCYTLRIAVASSTRATLLIWVNGDPKKDKAKFTSKLGGKDNAIARHGIHGLYSEVSFEIPGSLIVKGENKLYLRQSKAGYPFYGIMYDYIRLEAPKKK
ncbi:PREDICTED: probable rhamnogalacturonate lyase B isoform X2 [Ipomoea nil]|uniref:probable rhamnogalacturonate lyase B isoform X2 n=1 Tax=Ipomoea nil TaxID=35883 RepID=UPI00090201BC|nr:PREDICTED: probable rhamnogalacturonate lyase B isoform X2 [Ipomoea nil]